MKCIKNILLSFLSLVFVAYLVFYLTGPKNRNPLKTELVISDIDNFWLAFDQSKPGYSPAIFQEMYLDKGSKGLSNFMNYRIQNAEYFSKILSKYPKYYNSIRASTNEIPKMKGIILNNLVEFKKLYPKAVFPPIYFVVGVLNTGGTSFRNGLILGAEMYALTTETPIEELNYWQKRVLKPVEEIPSTVIHELVHFQQNNSVMNLFKEHNLLSASIDEGAADFLAELVTGKHLNGLVHNFANPLEKELWIEFKERMMKNDYTGWLNSTQEGRPNDLGYWMGYTIVKYYYDNSLDKGEAINEIINIRDYTKFLKKSKYPNKFNKDLSKLENKKLTL